MKLKTAAAITFRTKVRKMHVGDATRDYIDYKRKVSRTDCDLKPHQHDYFNSDLFPGMLQRAYDTAIEKREWQYLDRLPETVDIDASGFLAVITVRIKLC
jgi:hypothetical protein